MDILRSGTSMSGVEAGASRLGLGPRSCLPQRKCVMSTQLHLLPGWRSPAGTAMRTLASAVKEDRKTTGGRKGEGGRTTSGRGGPSSSPSNGPNKTGSGRREGSTSARQQQQPPPPTTADRRQQQAKTQQQQQQGKGRAGTNSPKQAASGGSQLDQQMRNHPFFSRFYDTTLILGDCIMIMATEASSARIEWSSFPALVAVLLVCWVGAGAWNGDYSPGGSRAHEDVPWQLSMLGPTFGSVLGAALTWAFASTASVAAYAVLVAHNDLDAAPVMEGLNSDDLSPQLEVVVALLITMTCWRGIVSRVRPNLLD